MTDEILIRKGHGDDIPFVTATWLHNYWNNSVFAKFLDRHLYFTEHHKVLQAILSHPACEIFVAHYCDEPEVIFGFLVMWNLKPKSYIHFLYVKQALRQNGIARQLIETSEVDLNESFCTHWTYDLNKLISKAPKLKYNPYFLSQGDLWQSAWKPTQLDRLGTSPTT